MEKSDYQLLLEKYNKLKKDKNVITIDEYNQRFKKLIRYAETYLSYKDESNIKKILGFKRK